MWPMWKSFIRNERGINFKNSGKTHNIENYESLLKITFVKVMPTSNLNKLDIRS